MGITINENTRIQVEAGALKGIKRVANCLTSDLEKVFGKKNDLIIADDCIGDNVVLAATVGYSEWTNKVDTSDIEKKREVYKYVMIDGRLAIIGSDKRGTIYGLFHLSELLGVSPFVDWFKLYPARKKSFEVTDSMMITSKEPSVRYRGFFINDEWPAFGNWCTKNYGGFNAKAYEQIFLLLLRMKGNYMWPAMWSAIFTEDGPGQLNEEIADELGVVMGMSHHEPCLRQGEEYRYLRGKDSVYGDAWNFRSNEAGITRFWEDGLKRSGKYENVITVGMRGEADTAIMGKEATLKDNIDLLRDVLRTQNRLIKENVNENLDEVPRMLALYKEVEPYFYGDENTEGLMNSPELEGVTLMLCDDNYGNLRTVPTEEMRNHKGGYGMYYHFDYHGFPISFEWVNSSYLPKVWEQMTTAYEFGIRDLWIVNVGDIFTTEYPLSYFLELAYDYDKWGISNLNSGREYTEEFVARNFGERCAKSVTDDMVKLLFDYSKIAHIRRPEAMNSEIYSPVMYKEADDLLMKIDELENIAEELIGEVEDDLKLPVFELMYYPARANLNVQKLQLETGKNHYYASISCNYARVAAEIVEKCLSFDESLVDRLHELDNGRWYGMGMSEHIGFKHWCEEECQYPVLHSFKPGNKPRILVEIPGSKQHTEGGVWTGKVLTLGDFLIPNVTCSYFELKSCGADCDYEIESSGDYLRINDNKGRIKALDNKKITVELDIDKLSNEPAEIIVKTDTGNIRIKVPVCQATETELAQKYSKGTYLWMGEDKNGDDTYSPYQYISMEAAGFIETSKVEIDGCTADFKEIPYYGKTVSAMKAFPVDKSFEIGKGPSISYDLVVKRSGKYCLDLYMNPSNAPFMDGHLYYGVSVNGQNIKKVDALPEGFKVGDNQLNWAKGVLDNIRISETEVELKEGLNRITIYAVSPSFVLEKLLVFEKDNRPEDSYLGPKETYRV